MSVRDTLLCLFLIPVWAFNFVAIKWGLAGFPPFALAACRFAVVAFPLVFFVGKTNVPFRWLLYWGGTAGLLQFSFLFFAIKLGLGAGMASLLLQFQVFFTFIFSLLLVKNTKIHRTTVYCMLVSFFGLSILMSKFFSQSLSVVPIILVLLAAASWGLSNTVVNAMNDRGYKPNMLAVVVKSSLLMPLPFMLLSLLTEEVYSVNADNYWKIILSIIYIAYSGSIFGLAIWTSLIQKYNAIIVSPFSLLVPVFGFIFSYLIFEEVIALFDFIGIIFIFIGFALNYLIPYYNKKKHQRIDIS